MEAGGPGNPGRDWRLRVLERGMGGWESWEERMSLGGQGGKLGVLWEAGLQGGGIESWGAGEEGLDAASPRNPGRKDRRLGVPGGQGGIERTTLGSWKCAQAQPVQIASLDYQSSCCTTLGSWKCAQA